MVVDRHDFLVEWAVVLVSGEDAGVGVWKNIRVRDPRDRRQFAFRILFPLITVRHSEVQPPVHGPDLSYHPLTRENGIPGPFFELAHFPMLRTRVHAAPMDEEEAEAAAAAGAAGAEVAGDAVEGDRPPWAMPGIEYSPAHADRLANLFRYGVRLDGSPKRKPGRKRGRGFYRRR